MIGHSALHLLDHKMLLTIITILLAITSASTIPWGNYQFGDDNAVRSTPTVSCRSNEVLLDDGTCTPAEVSQKLFFVAPPQLQLERRAYPTDLPKPKLHYNVVLVRAPEDPEDLDPIVVPPPQQKTLVYILNKDKEKKDAQIIQMPTAPQKPEVFFVNYKEGENPQLPIGIDLETALNTVQTLEGQVVEEETNIVPFDIKGEVAKFSSTTNEQRNNFGNEDIDTPNLLHWESSRQSSSSYNSPI